MENLEIEQNTMMMRFFLDDPKSYRNRNIGLDYNRGGEGFSGSATVEMKVQNLI